MTTILEDFLDMPKSYVYARRVSFTPEEAKDLWNEIRALIANNAATNAALTARVAELTAALDEARGALEIYADEGNWLYDSTCPSTTWEGEEHPRSPWLIARRALAGQPASGWIPCNQPPKSAYPVLLTIEEEPGERWTGTGKYENGCWWLYDHGNCRLYEAEPIAWMERPLPQPPQKEG